MRILITGGCKNGKSYLAQQLAQVQNPEKLYYIATMIPTDQEDLDRIENHKMERAGWGFETIEAGRDIHRILEGYDNEGSYLLDSVTALLSNEMFPVHGAMDLRAYEKVGGNLRELLERAGNMVLVSDYIYSDAMIYDEFTESYRRGLGILDRQMAAACDIVVEAVYTNYIIHKGQEAFRRLYEKIN